MSSLLNRGNDRRVFRFAIVGVLLSGFVIAYQGGCSGDDGTTTEPTGDSGPDTAKTTSIKTGTTCCIKASDTLCHSDEPQIAGDECRANGCYEGECPPGTKL